MSRWLPVVFLLAIPLPKVAGQPIRTDTRLVLVPVSVTDRRGATVNGLDRSNFTLFEDTARQSIVTFSAEDAPASVGLIFDTSGSMRGKLDVAKRALRAFVDNANSTDEAFLFAVSSRPNTSSTFTADLGSLAESANFLNAGGDTALIDTIYAGLERMRSASNPRRAILILSDGMDNHSRRSKSELMRLAVEADVQVYAIGIDSRVRTKKAMEQQEEQRGLALLRDLAEYTGGLHFTISDRDDANSVVTKAVLAMRNQYLLAYRPTQPVQPGKWHRIRVKLNVAHTTVSARSGYYWE
ncbi:MAG: VWA domain-containing protein [Bryobacteraceae bacterium]|jgi:Ca-activated chloride channel family protein